MLSLAAKLRILEQEDLKMGSALTPSNSLVCRMCTYLGQRIIRLTTTYIRRAVVLQFCIIAVLYTPKKRDQV